MSKPITCRTVVLAAITVFALSVARAQTPAPTPPQFTFTFTSVNVDLPAGDRMFPGGKEAEAINNNCLACHSAGMVLNQPDLSKAAWDAEVHKMISVYKAPVPAEDVPAVVAYLASTKGAK
jgi:cytochrome c5